MTKEENRRRQLQLLTDLIDLQIEKKKLEESLSGGHLERKVAELNENQLKLFEEYLKLSQH